MANELVDRTSEYWREHFQLDHMDIGSRLDVPFGQVARVKRTEFCLHHVNGGERARWGTSEEISQDIAHLAKTGVLPKAQGGRW
jgi:hypothetical protein